jgi:hypothetical protein
MSRYIPFSIPGSLEAVEGTDHAIGVLGIAGSVIRTYMVVGGAPSGDDLDVDVRDAVDGGGAGVSFTILDGTYYSAPVVTTLAVSATETVYVRVTEAAAALNLSGWIEFEPTGTEEVSTFFTTLSRVKTDHGIGVATWDAQLSRLIQGKSKAMQRWMNRDIVDTTYTEEVHSGTGWTDSLILHNRPVTSTETMVVKEDDVVVTASLYTSGDDEGVVYLTDAYWTSGQRNYKVTYSAGYTAIPEDLVMACTAEVRHEFNQSQPSVTNRLGIESNADASGGGTTYVPGGFLPATLEVMKSYRRLA